MAQFSSNMSNVFLGVIVNCLYSCITQTLHNPRFLAIIFLPCTVKLVMERQRGVRLREMVS